ncbi:MAG: hypothetical protein M3162_01615 [Thermoproteota archaeon]|nr:hypothetical protein [Thermoproteota archaeon]
MRFSLVLLPIFFLSLIQIVHAQSLSESINKEVEDNLENTFGAINNTLNSSNNTQLGNNSDPNSRTTTITTINPNSNSTTTTTTTNYNN